MAEIIHDPTRGWLLLTEKWPEIQKFTRPASTGSERYLVDAMFFDGDKKEEFDKAVAHCLSTAIEIDPESMQELLKDHNSPREPQDHHPYSVDAEFEVVVQWASMEDSNLWYDCMNGEKAGDNPTKAYRKIARLVKACVNEAELFRQYLLKIKEVCTAENYPFGYHAAAVNATIALVDEALARV